MHTTFWAHSENKAGMAHALCEHLRGTRERATACAHSDKYKHLLALAANLHDLGKYLAEFQTYLIKGGARGSVPHARWGAIIARKLNAWEVSFAVDGHHAGLPDRATWEHEHTQTDAEELACCRQLLERFFADTGLTQKELAPPPVGMPAGPLERDVLTRFIFSCLTDADWLDTEAHFSPEKPALRAERLLDADVALARVEAELTRLVEKSESGVGGINELRNQARMHALRKAPMPTGFFSLNLPTGLGKTLTSFHWALEHAKANGLERVIIVLPYVNIIDQTAAKLKDILGPDQVLEHHSGYAPAAKSQSDAEMEERKRLACENWEYPVIVTTSVQFYETLFSNAPGTCRKLHNIANSVVILDEVQTLNKDLVLPTLDMLRDVQTVLHTSFVFCTATMPAFGKREGFPGVETITELVDNAEELFDRTVRVRFEQLEELRPISLDDLHGALLESDVSTLAILNTKRPIRDLYLALRDAGNWDRVFHLSTSLCPHHRKRLIAEIRVELDKRPQPRILVLSTQLVEAGVDLDFPCVFREIAPLEAVIQAAGRCNREGAMEKPGRVVLFQLAGAHAPDPFYKTQAHYVRDLLASGGGNLYDYRFFQAYYRQILSLFVTQKTSITENRAKLNFASVSGQYKLIPDATRPLFISEYNEDSHQLYEQIRFKEKQAIKLSRDDHRALQQYSVQVYETFFRQTRGLWSELACGVRVWDGKYDEGIGLDIDSQYTDALIV